MAKKNRKKIITIKEESNEEILKRIRNLPDNTEGLILRKNPLTNLAGVRLPSKLKFLNLSHTKLTNLKDVEFPEGLEQLSLSGTPLKTLKDAAFPDSLRYLRLNQIHELDLADAAFPKDLSQLFLSNSSLKNCDNVVFPPNLTWLWIDGTNLTALPDSIRHLKKLASLNLSNLKLAELPDWLTELELPFYRQGTGGICLEETAIKGINMAVFDKTQEEILQWFKERNILEPLNELKVVFLGDGEAGKTHTITRLLNNGKQVQNFRSTSTPGIVIKDKRYTIGNRDVQVHFWDFGGQEILHSMHRMFLTTNTLYVVFLNVRDGTQGDRAWYWLNNLKSFANGAPVLLVLNKMDMNQNASVNENDLRKLYPELKKIVKLSTLTYSDERFQKEFIDVLLEQIDQTVISEPPIIAAGRRVKNKIQNMKANCIHGSEFRRICDECGVIGSDNIRRGLLDTFSQLGVSFCYSGSARLEDYVVLRPGWITNAMYIILFNQLEKVKNGLVKHNTIYKMLTSGDMEKVSSAVIKAVYQPEDVDFVLNVFRKFSLSFLVRDGEEFIPMLCDANTAVGAASYETDPHALEFCMHYEYLPDNVIHRLMVERRRELDFRNVWRTGARFVYDNTGLSAVVKSEDELIRIIVRKDNAKGVAPQFYLDALKDDLERISREMGLTVTKTEVVYKSGEKVAHFDYEELLYAQEEGDTHIRSRALGGKVAIADILKQSDHPADEAKNRFIRTLTNACVKLQDNRNYWISRMSEEQRKTCEDDRTTYLRDMLSGADYICMDQHLTGDAVGGHRAGELDLEESIGTWSV